MSRKKKEPGIGQQVLSDVESMIDRINTIQVDEAEEEAQIEEMCGLILEDEDNRILEEVKAELANTSPVLQDPPKEVAMVKPVTPSKLIPSWDQIKNQLHSVSAMKKALTGERITHGDAIAIFKTDSHRKLYEAWAASEREKAAEQL